MFEVWYVLPKGKHMCMVCTSEAALVSLISKLRRSARIMQDGQHIGKVFHDGNKWGWFYSPNGTPNKACKRQEPAVESESQVACGSCA